MSKLQDAVTPTAFPYVARTLKSELGAFTTTSIRLPSRHGVHSVIIGINIPAVFSRFDERPIAAASIAQVGHRAGRMPGRLFALS